MGGTSSQAWCSGLARCLTRDGGWGLVIFAVVVVLYGLWFNLAKTKHSRSCHQEPKDKNSRSSSSETKVSDGWKATENGS
ncbi:hypothetical protein Peur_045956 [Populus x canadensis]